MNKKSGMNILVRRGSLSEIEWHEMVARRINMITPNIPDMSLKSIGDIVMINDYFGNHDLKRDKPEIIGTEFDLLTKGILPNDNNCSGIAFVEYQRREDSFPISANYKLWGFTVKGEWITIEVCTTFKKEPYKYAGRTETVQTVKTVEIKTSNLADICVFCKRSPKDIWMRFGQIIKNWSLRCRSDSEFAKRMEDIVLSEETLIEMIPKI